MLTDWTHWLSGKHPDQLFVFLWALLLIDFQRYALLKIVLCLFDMARDGLRRLLGIEQQRSYEICPSVCVILAGYNEECCITATLESVWGSYPRLEILVVDDGSTDNMFEVARRFARDHAGVRVFRRPTRGGKASASNFALRYCSSEIVIVLDTDSVLGPNAIWEIVQPFKNPQVAAVSGSILARNPYASLCAFLQAYEYLSSIFVGRMLSAKLGILGIVSGAWGAFRTGVLERCKGWDVGPPEDLDLTLVIRKAGYEIAFTPYAECYTDVPESWKGLINQRRRWERAGAMRNHCRKHLDMAYFWSPNFRLGNLVVLLENWFFNVILMYGIWIWIIGFIIWTPPDWPHVLWTLYFCYAVFELIQILATAYYSNHPKRDLIIAMGFFLMPFYQMLQLCVRLFATTEELFFRNSYHDNYVPPHVRQATWKW